MAVRSKNIIMILEDVVDERECACVDGVDERECACVSVVLTGEVKASLDSTSNL